MVAGQCARGHPVAGTQFRGVGAPPGSSLASPVAVLESQASRGQHHGLSTPCGVPGNCCPHSAPGPAAPLEAAFSGRHHVHTDVWPRPSWATEGAPDPRVPCLLVGHWRGAAPASAPWCAHSIRCECLLSAEA